MPAAIAPRAAQDHGEGCLHALATSANKQGRVRLQRGSHLEIFDGVVGSQLVKVFELEIGKTGLGRHDASGAGIPCEEVSASWHDLAGYYPGSEPMFVKLFIDPRTRVLIGAQTVGVHGAALRTNIMATAITARMTVDEFAYLDLGYAPPFAPVWDSLLVTAQKMVKR
jgi:NADPH-dependent 2,4-dienoyl-CoA reductase/sulfur reductase-like enzyme